jgi:hypothetical protein
MKTMKAVTATMKTVRKTMPTALSCSACTRPMVSKIAGTRPTTMPAKMISEMPLPMPRSLICSPSHMTTAQPVVSVITVISTKPTPGSGTSGRVPGAACCRNTEMPIDWMIEMTMVP